MYIELTNSVTYPDYDGNNITYDRIIITKVNIYPVKRIIIIEAKYSNSNNDMYTYKTLTKVNEEYDNITLTEEGFYQLFIDDGLDGTIVSE